MLNAIKRAAARRSINACPTGQAIIAQHQDSLSWPDSPYSTQYRCWDRREVVLYLRKRERFLFDR